MTTVRRAQPAVPDTDPMEWAPVDKRSPKVDAVSWWLAACAVLAGEGSS